MPKVGIDELVGMGVLIGMGVVDRDAHRWMINIDVASAVNGNTYKRHSICLIIPASVSQSFNLHFISEWRRRTPAREYLL